jgi:hypothetical protein
MHAAGTFAVDPTRLNPPGAGAEPLEQTSTLSKTTDFPWLQATAEALSALLAARSLALLKLAFIAAIASFWQSA